jgi:rubredoxin
MESVEIICTKCGADTLLQREAIYDGFMKTGEKLICSSCGHEYASEAGVPFKSKPSEPKIFTEADRSAKIKVFNEGENQRLCRHCANYIVNPFTQFCATHKKEVQATDSCKEFSERDDENGSKTSIFPPI